MTQKARRTIQVDDDQLAAIKAYREMVAADLGVSVSLAEAVTIAISQATVIAKKRSVKNA